MEINLSRVSLEGYHGRSDFVVGCLFRRGGRLLRGGGVDQRVAASIAVLHTPRQPPLTISCAMRVESA